VNNERQNADTSSFSAALAWLDELAVWHRLRVAVFDTLEMTEYQRRTVRRGRYVDLETNQALRQARILAKGEVIVLVRARRGEAGQFMVDLCAPGFSQNHYQNLWCEFWELELFLLLTLKR